MFNRSDDQQPPVIDADEGADASRKCRACHRPGRTLLGVLTLALALALTQTPQHRLFQQPNLPRSSLAFFEAFLASGAGTSGVCSTTAPTGARGETLTFTRASSATCTQTATGGLATTGIADGDLVTLSSNVARVEYDSAGVLGLRKEIAATNLLLRFIEYFDAAWSDVGTPTNGGAATSPFAGSLSGSAVEIEDNDGAAYEGRSQTITVSAGAAHTAHCYARGTALKSARITLDGTAATISGLSETTWSIITVTDASSSGTSIVFEVLNGDSVDDTGSIIWGGCQVETGSRWTSIIPTTSATVTRATDGVPTFPVALASGSAASVAVSITTNYTPTTGITLTIPHNSANPPMLGRFSGGNFGCYQLAVGADLAAGTWTTGANRWACSTARSTHLNGTTNTGSASAFSISAATVGIGSSGGFGAAVDGIYSRLCVDPTATRCSP